MSLFRRSLLLASATGGIVYEPVLLRYNRAYDDSGIKREYTKVTTGTYDSGAGITYYEYNYTTNLYVEKTGLSDGDSIVGLFTKSASDFDTLGTYAIVEEKSGTGNSFEPLETYRGLNTTDFSLNMITSSIIRAIIPRYINQINVSSGISGDIIYTDISNLKIIQVDANNTTYYASNNIMFETSTNKIILGISNSIIPSNIVQIGDCSFRYGEFETLTIPSTYTFNTSTNISRASFRYSTITDKLTINTSSQLGYSMFANSTINLLEVNTGAYGTSAYPTFNGTTFNQIDLSNTTTIGSSLFASSIITQITIPSNITTMGPLVFKDVDELTNMTFLHSNSDTITLPTDGSSSGFLYSKTARNMTIYTDNETIKNYNYSGDNITATILHIDGSAW